MSHQNGIQFGKEPQADGNTKQELIKMLLEMTPGDVSITFILINSLLMDNDIIIIFCSLNVYVPRKPNKKAEKRPHLKLGLRAPVIPC
jgi:hypothetical protein